MVVTVEVLGLLALKDRNLILKVAQVVLEALVSVKFHVLDVRVLVALGSLLLKI